MPVKKSVVCCACQCRMLTTSLYNHLKSEKHCENDQHEYDVKGNLRQYFIWE